MCFKTSEYFSFNEEQHLSSYDSESISSEKLAVVMKIQKANSQVVLVCQQQKQSCLIIDNSIAPSIIALQMALLWPSKKWFLV